MEADLEKEKRQYIDITKNSCSLPRNCFSNARLTLILSRTQKFDLFQSGSRCVVSLPAKLYKVCKHQQRTHRFLEA